MNRYYYFYGPIVLSLQFYLHAGRWNDGMMKTIRERSMKRTCEKPYEEPVKRTVK